MKHRTVPYPDNPVIKIDVNEIPEEIKWDLARATYEAVLRSLRDPETITLGELHKIASVLKLEQDEIKEKLPV